MLLSLFIWNFEKKYLIYLEYAKQNNRLAKSLHVNKIPKIESVEIFPSRFLELPQVKSALPDFSKSRKKIVTHQQNAEQFLENKFKLKGNYFKI